jgi:hypothetical protein
LYGFCMLSFFGFLVEGVVQIRHLACSELMDWHAQQG